MRTELDATGCALTGALLSATEAADLAVLYDDDTRFRSTVPTVIPHGHGLVFTTRDRPVPSKRGWSAASVRHGVSVIRSGSRLTLGLVFHDAT